MVLYVSGKHALNLDCELNTWGDSSGLKWEDIYFKESKASVFKEWGIENIRKIPNGMYMPVANHIRAVLDLLEEGKGLRLLRGLNKEILGTDEYNKILFEKIVLLRKSIHWREIHDLISSEYGFEWLEFESKDRNKLVGKDFSKVDFNKLRKLFKRDIGIKDLSILLDILKENNYFTSESGLDRLVDFFYYTGINHWEYEIHIQYYKGLDKKKLLEDIKDIYTVYNLELD